MADKRTLLLYKFGTVFFGPHLFLFFSLLLISFAFSWCSYIAYHLPPAPDNPAQAPIYQGPNLYYPYPRTLRILFATPPKCPYKQCLTTMTTPRMTRSSRPTSPPGEQVFKPISASAHTLVTAARKSSLASTWHQSKPACNGRPRQAADVANAIHQWHHHHR